MYGIKFVKVKKISRLYGGGGGHCSSRSQPNRFLFSKWGRDILEREKRF